MAELSCNVTVFVLGLFHMEIAVVSPSSIRIKGKQVSFVVDPTPTKAKQAADAVFITQGNTLESPDIEGVRLTMSGAGEYEVGGVKITGVKSGETTSYFFTVDGITMLIAAASSLNGKESLRDVAVAVIAADTLADQSALATVANAAAVFYGEQAAENVKALGKEVQPIAKYVTTKEKLPQEMEVVLLA